MRVCYFYFKLFSFIFLFITIPGIKLFAQDSVLSDSSKQEISITVSEIITQDSIVSDRSNHEISIFFIKSAAPIEWTSPERLYKSTFNCYVAAAFKKNYNVIGHTIARVVSTSMPDTGFYAMSGAIQSEKVELVMGKQLGFGALGSTIHGMFEPEMRIKKGIALYAKRKNIAFIKFIINDASLKRIQNFVEYFKTKNQYGYAPCELYNGACYPAYEYEGSACSAFGMSLLDVAGVLPDESKKWMVDIKIPIDLVGGEFNQNKKIKTSSITKAKSWYEGDGVEGIDYAEYKVYVPDRAFNWIENKRSDNDSIYKAIDENGIPGVVVDMTSVEVDTTAPVLKKRKISNLFVNTFSKNYIRPEILIQDVDSVEVKD